MRKHYFFGLLFLLLISNAFAQSWQVCSDSIYSNILNGNNLKAEEFLKLAEVDMASKHIAKDTTYADFLYRKGLVIHLKKENALPIFLKSIEIWKSSGFINQNKLMKLNYFIAEKYDSQEHYKLACKHYKEVVRLTNKKDLGTNSNYVRSLQRLMAIEAYLNDNYKLGKKYANLYLDAIGKDKKYYQAYIANDILGNYKEQIDILLYLIEFNQEKLLETPEDINRAKWTYEQYVTLTSICSDLNDNKGVIEYGEKAILFQNEYKLPKDKLLYLNLIVAYDNITDKANSHKYNKLLNHYFPEENGEIDYYSELEILVNERKYDVFSEKFNEFEKILISKSDFDNLLSIYAFSVTLFEQSILFSKVDIDEQLNLIESNKHKLNDENATLYLGLLSEYNFFNQNFINALNYANKCIKDLEDLEVKLKLLQLKGLSESMLGLRDATRTLEKTVNLAIEIYGEENPQILSYINTYLNIKMNLNELKEDELNLSAKALRIVYSNNIENTEIAAQTYYFQGSICFSMSNFNDAIYYYNCSRNIYDSNKELNNIYTYYGNLLSIARCYIYLKEFDKGLNYLNETYKLISDSENIMEIAWGDYNETLGEYYFFQDKFDSAEESFQKAYDIYGENLSALRQINLLLINYFKSKDYKQLQKYYNKNGDLDNISLYIYSHKYNKESISNAQVFLVNHLLKKIEDTKGMISLLSNKELGIALSNQRNMFEFLNGYLLNNGDNSFLEDYLNIRFYYKSLLLNWTSKTESETQSKYYTEYQDNNTLINKMLESNHDYSEEIEKLKLRNSELEKFFSEGSTSYTTPTFKDVNKALHVNQAYVEIIRINRQNRNKNASIAEMILEPFTDSIHYGAIVIKKNLAPKYIHIDDENILENWVQTHYNSYTYGNNKASLDSVSYSLLFEKIDKELNGIKDIYLSTDGIYNTMNLENLHNPYIGKFLIDYLNVKMVSSVWAITDNEEEKNHSKQAVLFGNPTFKFNSSNPSKQFTYSSNTTDSTFLLATTRGNSIEALPGTKKEIEDISNALGNNRWRVTLYTKEKASEDNIKNIASPTILHIATHGFYYDADKPKRHQKRYLGYEISKMHDNVFLRSGLLLAGAQSSIENGITGINNGILTAQEVKNLNLTNTKLVTLSACETGLGENKVGDGIYGLQRAFMIAGAQSIMMSLWKVDDEATQKLMSLFYRNWIEKAMSKHEALRQAKLELKDIYPEPYYWSGFVLIE